MAVWVTRVPSLGVAQVTRSESIVVPAWCMGPGVTTPPATRKMRKVRPPELLLITDWSPRLKGFAVRLPSATTWLWPHRTPSSPSAAGLSNWEKLGPAVPFASVPPKS